MEFKQVQSVNKPIQIDEKSSKAGVYIRICVTEKQLKDSDTKYYEYLEAYLTKEEWKQYNLMATIQGIVIDAPTLEYNYKMNIPIQYTVEQGGNGFYYKPIWAESIYYDKIKAYDVHPEQFPLEIYDVTHKKENMVKMSVEDLKKLSDFLYAYQKLYFEQKQAQQAI